MKWIQKAQKQKWEEQAGFWKNWAAIEQNDSYFEDYFGAK